MITPQAAGNLAPQPIVRMGQSIIRTNESITFNVSETTDPDGSGRLRVEWDLDGDGTFDTVASTNLSLTTSFDTPGGRMVVARVIDGAGASALSMPVPIRVMGATGDYDADGEVAAADYDAWRMAYSQFSVPYFQGDGNGDARVNAADYVVWRNATGGAAESDLLVHTAVPEPRAMVLVIAALAGSFASHTRRSVRPYSELKMGAGSRPVAKDLENCTIRRACLSPFYTS
jgi:hypothetical protein